MTLFLPSLVGATGSAKTKLACLVAATVPIEIVGADSRQIYRGFDVGTAKPTAEERAAAPHHLIDCADPRETFTAARFGDEARSAAARIAARGRIPLLVGGSGLYVRAAERGLFDGPGAEPALRARLESRARREGTAALHAELRRVDPVSAARIGPADLVRVVRALEVAELTGIPISKHQELHREAPPPVRTLRFGIEWDPERLAERVAARAAAMLEAGWADEVRRNLASGIPEDAPAWNALGYASVRDLVGGAIDREEAVRRIAADTRRFAKRQRTWFRAQPETVWFRVESEEELPAVAARIAERLGDASARGARS